MRLFGYKITFPAFMLILGIAWKVVGELKESLEPYKLEDEPEAVQTDDDFYEENYKQEPEQNKTVLEQIRGAANAAN